MPGPGRTDFEAVWVAAAKAGFVACFEELVRRNQNTIFGFAVLTTQNLQDAEEVLQETFIKAYQRLRDFRRELRFSTWLLRMALRESLGKLQNRRGPPIHRGECSKAEDGFQPREVEGWGPEPEKRYTQTELHRILSEALRRLGPLSRIVFVLRDIEQLTSTETAQLLGLSLPAVKTRLLCARLAMREQLNPYFGASSNWPLLATGASADGPAPANGEDPAQSSRAPTEPLTAST